MRLKSLEIKGFKSFADKTLINLDYPVTGVVGPNGCGKSNIVDAIRWVIGEHKIKSLRSDNLDDLVFNGSKSRSAAGMAEVSLTFENTRNLLPTEFSTVTITRKFFKSGDSEYRLNGITCRLKDIHNLFLDTGVSNDSYAIIELGMVDDIIKDKDGSRRRMLEQAAGISIYKARKKETKAKLEATQQDISRIEDLLFEIANNLRTLESQARKAERYLQIKEDYKKTSIELAKVSLQEFTDKYQGLQQTLEAEQDRRLKIETEIAGDEAEIESKKTSLIHEEQELARLQKQFNDLVNRVRLLESEKKLSAQHLSHLKDREAGIRTFLKNAEAQQTQLEAGIEQTGLTIETERAAFEIAKEQLEQFRLELDEKRKDFDTEKENIEQARKALQEIQHKQFDEEKKLAVTDTALANYVKSKALIEEENQQRHNQIEQLSRQNETLEASKTGKAEQLEALSSQLKDWGDTEEQLRGTIESLREQSADLHRTLDARKNERDLLKSLIDSLEGYPESIKYLKKSKAWNTDAPLLSDIFTVQKQYRIALEGILGQYLNYYVVSQTGDALKAIDLLHQDKKGKVNFFILNRFKAPPVRQITVPAGWVAAKDVVDCEPAYADLLHTLLENIFITDTPEPFDPEILPEGAVVMTRSGKLMMGDYTLGGGSVGLFEGNKIGRQKNLQHLQEEADRLEKEAGGLKDRIAESQQQLRQVQEKIRQAPKASLEKELNQLNNQLIQNQNRIEHIQQLVETGRKRQESLEADLAAQQSAMGLVQSKLEEIKGLASQARQTLEEQTRHFREVEQHYNNANQEYNQRRISITQHQNKVQAMEQELRFRKSQLEELSGQVIKNNTQLKEIANSISETSGKLHFGDNELQDLLEKKEKEERSLNERDKNYYHARNALNTHEQKISRQRKDKEQAEGLVNNLKEKISEMKLQVAGMKERLQVEFKVDLEAILDEARESDLDGESLQQEAERLRKRMDNMGEINPTAIEAFQEIKIRHDFIVEQKEDLEKAKETLLATIEEVELTANRKFKETFDQIRENFITVFKALFTEDDQADLRLTDPENVAESNIEIYAQPKGKRPSTLTQLSGGEKTLTSTAFLFAIYLIKPAPFCVLDEVDAPLDDANVGKFTQMIRKFSDNSQFIIVTHNKQTMASVDVIYGVTMQEVGVSKLVPVDFRSLNN